MCVRWHVHLEFEVFARDERKENSRAKRQDTMLCWQRKYFYVHNFPQATVREKKEKKE